MNADETASPDDPHHLRRFTNAQVGAYERALAEIRAGDKRTHWMWFIFPQIVGLGSSSTAKHYAIQSRKQASEYLNHPVLGPRLRECAEAVFAVEGRTASEIFGYPDDLKLRSCMTLFAKVAEPASVFERVLEKYFSRANDVMTLEILARQEQRMS
jgi:uncharacterized protein (DUF1810 family)